MHGGTVEAHSDGTGRGSEFVVRLPVATCNGRGQRNDQPTRPPHRTAAFWFVDGSVDCNRRRFVLTMSGLGTAGGAHDGLGIGRRGKVQKPNVMLLDIRMPKLNGLAKVTTPLCDKPIRQRLWW
jgi:CheY-like chemotaxis protein